MSSTDHNESDLTLGKDVPRDHSFDGIVEYDNIMPRWIVAILILTIIFAGIYPLYYHLGEGKLGPERWEQAEKLALEERLANQTGPLPEEELVNMLSVNDYIEAGKAAWKKANCQQCHLENLQGNIGPNMLDDYWIHGNSLSEMIDVVANGRNNNQMPPQKTILSQTEIRNVVLYVAKMNLLAETRSDGSAPGKEPQGELRPLDY